MERFAEVQNIEHFRYLPKVATKCRACTEEGERFQNLSIVVDLPQYAQLTSFGALLDNLKEEENCSCGGTIDVTLRQLPQSLLVNLTTTSIASLPRLNRIRLKELEKLRSNIVHKQKSGIFGLYHKDKAAAVAPLEEGTPKPPA